MVAALREMQENQRFSEIRIDKQEFISAVHSYFASLQTHNSSLSKRGDAEYT